MTKLNRLLRSFRSDDRGSLAVNIALTSPVLVGIVAFAVDVNFYRLVDTHLQTAADSGALAAARVLTDPDAATLEAIDFADRNVPDSYGTVTTTADVDFGTWDTATRTFTVATGTAINAVRVTAQRSAARGNAPQRYFGALYGTDGIQISASAVAVGQVWGQYQPPESVDLSPNAWDYNEMWAYCFDYLDTDEPAADRRTQMTLISNNLPAGTSVEDYTYRRLTVEPDATAWPICEQGESLSFRLRNFREAKEFRSRWVSPYLDEHNHYTDTVIVDGVEQFNLDFNILETIKCDTFEECDPSHPDSTIPTGFNRTPEVSSIPCIPGRFIYFGWEDRPTGDADYDDIRIVLECPETGALGDGRARLVQ